MNLNDHPYAFASFNNNGQSVFRNTEAAYPSGFSYLTNKVNVGTGQRESTTRWNLSIPHIATSADVCACVGQVLGTDYIQIEGKFSAATSATDRLDAYERLVDLVADLQFKASFTGLVQPSA